MNTQNFGLPLLAPSQAQKHVTVNEALMLTDALLGLRVDAVGVTALPESPAEGAAVLLSESAANSAGMDKGSVALRLSGLWREIAPREGLEVSHGAGRLRYLAGRWRADQAALAPGGAGTWLAAREIAVQVEAGPEITVPAALKPGRLVLGVTARAHDALAGAGVTWSIGVAESRNRYGSQFGVAAGSYAEGLTSAPMAYYTPTDLVFTANGGALTGGRVTLAIHEMRLTPPRE
ncbi:DUF2793 domain-containing protein [Paracoccaceae bacterium GXU_MW_L88]